MNKKVKFLGNKKMKMKGKKSWILRVLFFNSKWNLLFDSYDFISKRGYPFINEGIFELHKSLIQGRESK